ncbi:putative secreted protein with PEP-CTERM sorting signal [Roseiarcus fermentans]|uniref:Putative secreted protein with PEP-CTERM sorting signal n=2 Tax=Roseiarcus fermentans TaxID=1473586 RepID=A0A366FHV5_9HYPH|nr:putative secreted protein with PEP-CTERM sorting signal [Roseiarcus fermentans]
MKWGRSTIAAFALFAAMPIVGAGASETYAYVGDPFTQFDSPTYTSSDYAALSFTLPSALGDNFSGAVEPTSFTASDGIESFSNGPLSSIIAVVDTNSTGQISEWAIFAWYSYGTSSTPGTNARQVFTSYGLGDSVTAINDLVGNHASTQDQVQLWQCPFNQCEEYAEASTFSNPGSWTAVASDAPEPSTWALMIIGFAGLGCIGNRWRTGAPVAA